LADERRRVERFLPPDPRVEEPYLFTPKMALRVAILGAVALVVFAVLFLRLWSLQILSATKYANAALNNQLRTVRGDAPRGPILDREGRVLVTNIASTAVEVWPADLPKQGRYAEMKQLAIVLHMRLPKVLAKLEERKGDLLTPVTIRVAVHPDQVDYLAEHQREFPGVHTKTVYLRKYNSQALLAQVLGYVGEISPAQLKQARKDCHEPQELKVLCPQAGDQVGEGGVELAYDKYLRGTPEIDDVRINALGRPTARTVTRTHEAGNAVQLTIDISLQLAAERALKYGIRLAHQDNHWYANGGAIVAMDPNNGDILAMASSPTFKPSVFVGRPSAEKLAPLLNPAVAKKDNYPGLNRVTQGLYPPGSTFKPVTALAAMQERLISPFQTLQCSPTYDVRDPSGHVTQVFKNWDPYSNEPMTMPQAIGASCDTYFYNLGYAFYALPADRGHPLQGWASRFGFGAPTSIDVGPEDPGLLPTPEWRQATYTKKSDPCCWQVDRLWKPGDSIQLAIGQKDLLVTPLQMVRFYSLIANGGNLVRPRVVDAVQVPGTKGWQPLNPAIPKSSGVDPNALAIVRDGLWRATHATYGTATSVFGSFPIPVAGKTGTAEKAVQPPGYKNLMLQDQSWWCGYAPADKPKIAVCAVIENGGHGGTAAAPAALKIFEQYFHAKAPPIGSIYSD
jgi:penicillin-binding protein 2